VRAYLGYRRFDTVAQTNAISQLYEKLWLYDNFFQPVMRLKEKIISCSQDGQPSRITRLYDQAKTPFQRLCETEAISQEDQARLRALYERTNPLALLDEIFDLLDQIFLLPCAAHGQIQNVYETLNLNNPRREEGSSVTLSLDRMTASR